MFTKEEFEKVAEILDDCPRPIFLGGLFSGLLLLSFGVGFDLIVLVCIGIPLIIVSVIYGVLSD